MATLLPRLTVRLAEAPAVAPALIGRTPEQAVALVGPVHSLCAHAHVEAAERAIAAASNVALPEARSAVLSAATRAEAIREQGMRIALDWPGLIGEAPDMAAASGWMRAGDDAARRRAIGPLLGMAGADWLRGDIRAWLAAATTMPARVIAGMTRFDEAGIADGREVSPWMRHRGAPMLAAVPALAARFLARLLDLVAAVEGVLPKGGVWTARGRLAHRCDMAGGRITTYAIESPTEVHFGPDGVATRALCRAAAGPRAGFEAIVRAFDPCLPFTIEAA